MIILLFCFSCLLIGLPFFLAGFEIFQKTDVQPLQISNQILKDPRSVPAYVFWYLSHLAEVNGLEELHEKLKVLTPTLLGKQLWVLPEGVMGLVPAEIARVASRGDLQLPEKRTYLQKIVSLQSVRVGEAAQLNEVHAQEDLCLGRSTKLVWWATANRILLEAEVHLPGKLQAREKIIFKGGGSFHLLQAPLIRSEQPFASTRDLWVSTNQKPALQKNRVIKNADMFLADHERLEETLIVRGDLTIGRNACVVGDLKVHGNLLLKEGATVDGNVIGLKNIQMLGKNHVSGTVLAHLKLEMSSGVQVGMVGQSVTVSAQTILIDGAFQIYGLLRAWKRGVITPLFH